MSRARFPAEQVVVDDLVRRVRYFVAEHFEDVKQADTQFRRLVKAGTVAFQDVVIAPVVDAEPLLIRQPQEQEPDWNDLAADLRRRWSALSAIPIRLYFATPKAVYLRGGEMTGQIRQMDALSHDLGLSSAFLQLCGASEGFRTAWIPEELIPQEYGQVHPDALLADSTGPRAVVEFCGMYSAERLKRLADFSDSIALPLQLWTCVVHRTHQ